MPERLEYVLKQSGWSQSELARRTGVKQQTISRMCTGQTQNSRCLVTVCQELGVNPEWLSSGVGDIYQGEVKGVSQMTKVPLINWHQAKEWKQIKGNLKQSGVEEWRLIPTNTLREGFALRVKGDSMEGTGSKTVPDGAIIFVDTTTEWQSEDLVIASLPKSSEATFKQYVIDGNKAFLRSYNPLYPLIPLDGDCEIIGKVKLALVEFG